MNPITIFAGQNAGASLGNLICPNNTVAACATVDQMGNENKVMKRTLPAFAIILVIYMVLTMLYTCVLFPNFGVKCKIITILSSRKEWFYYGKKRVLGVIGLGHVGAHVAYSLAVQGIADELVLVDQNEQKLASEVQDLRDAGGVSCPTASPSAPVTSPIWASAT